jgi:hypothetical protein
VGWRVSLGTVDVPPTDNLEVGVPLDAWRCDTCGARITDPLTGIVIWRCDSDGTYSDFRIVHKETFSPGPSCDPNNDVYNNSTELQELLGETGVAYLLSFLTAGPIITGPNPDPDEDRSHVADMPGFVDLFRRAQTPWYEEARTRFQDSRVLEWFGGNNEHAPYVPETLEEIAKNTFGR